MTWIKSWLAPLLRILFRNCKPLKSMLLYLSGWIQFQLRFKGLLSRRVTGKTLLTLLHKPLSTNTLGSSRVRSFWYLPQFLRKLMRAKDIRITIHGWQLSKTSSWSSHWINEWCQRTYILIQEEVGRKHAFFCLMDDLFLNHMLFCKFSREATFLTHLERYGRCS